MDPTLQAALPRERYVDTTPGSTSATRSPTASGSASAGATPSGPTGTGGFDPGDARELWDLVNRQGRSICESVQRGMSSRSYRHGWFAPMEDDSLDIRRWLLPRVGGR